MLFNSIDFIVFFNLLLLLLFFVRQYKNQKVIFLLASYLFYMWWNPAFILLIILSTVIDFFLGQKIHKDKNKKPWLILSIMANLGILGFFKYFGGKTLEWIERFPPLCGHNATKLVGAPRNFERSSGNSFIASWLQVWDEAAANLKSRFQVQCSMLRSSLENVATRCDQRRGQDRNFVTQKTGNKYFFQVRIFLSCLTRLPPVAF